MNNLKTLLGPTEIIDRQRLFFSRSDFNVQWLAIGLSLVVGFLLSKWLWRWLRHRFPKSMAFEWSDRSLSWREYGAALVQSLDFPLVTLLLLIASRLFYLQLGWKVGLIAIVYGLMKLYLGYRFLLTTLYSAFPIGPIQKYESRFLTPLFILYVFASIINLNIDLGQVSRTPLFSLFNAPVTTSSIFWLTAGIYFWFGFVSLVENLFLLFAASKNESDRGAIEATLLLLRYFLYTVGVIFILGLVGFDSTAIAAITGGLSVGIGFGLKEVIANFVSGIILLFERVLKPGDVIDLEGDVCEVKKLGIRATTVKKIADNSEKIVPNQTFFTSDVTTFTGSDRLVNCSIVVGVGYGSKAGQVLELLLDIAKLHPKILFDPPPLAFFLNFGDSSLNFELKFWLNDIHIRKRVISDLNCQILEAFAQHDIEIPFPQRDIRIRKD
jgi:small-conductance mechanosensitive channel